MSTANDLVQEVKSIYAAADAAGRPLTANEYHRVDGLLDQIEDRTEHNKRLRSIPDLSPEVKYMFANAFIGGGPGQRPDSPGARFVGAKAYHELFGSHASRPERWTTGMIDITDGPPTFAEYKGTLSEAVGGGALVSVPQVAPGVVGQLSWRRGRGCGPARRVPGSSGWRGGSGSNCSANCSAPRGNPVATGARPHVPHLKAAETGLRQRRSRFSAPLC